MYARLMKGIYRLENNRAFSSVRNGFVLVIPVVLTGSLALLIQNFPIPGFSAWLAGFCGGLPARLLDILFNATVGFLSVFLVLAISFYDSEYYAKKDSTLRTISMFTALACFVATFGPIDNTLTIDVFGTTGVFSALVCAIVSTRLFFGMCRLIFGGLRSRLEGSDIHYRSSMAAIMPMMLCVLVFSLANAFLVGVLHVENFNALVSNALMALFTNIRDQLTGGVLFTLLLNLLWMFGIHGGNALDSAAQTIFAPENVNPGSLISKSFLDNFAMIGGSGATICLLLALFLAARSKPGKRMALSAAPLVFFNINEALVFGLPVVLNPILFLPFILTPVVSLLIAYGAVVAGIMPAASTTVTWTTPVLFSGYLATGSLRGTLVQFVIILVGTAIYYPFVRFSERLRDERSAFMLRDLSAQFFRDEKFGETSPYLTRADHIGVAANQLIAQLREDIAAGNIPVSYQPQTDADGTVKGAEALLRWKFNGDPVPPPLAILLAREDGCFNQLTEQILSTVCRDAATLCRTENPDIRISANIVAEQLDDPLVIQAIIALSKKHGVCRNLILEVTEESALGNLQNVSANIDLLAGAGIAVAIDDFSMGQTSLNYLRTNRFRYVKLDGSIVRQAAGNERCREIIASIIALGKSLDFQVTAEYVESREIHDMLLQLGCQYFQGFLFSPALPLTDFTDYLHDHSPAESHREIMQE